MKIIGTGSVIPKKIVTNDMLSEFLDTSDAWIYPRTGIKDRHDISDENPEDMAIEAAKAAGATALFTAKYGEQVKVYTMGDFSKEVCGGPHAQNTAELVAFKILKEESSSAGVRRIKAIIGEPALEKRKAAGK